MTSTFSFFKAASRWTKNHKFVSTQPPYGNTFGGRGRSADLHAVRSACEFPWPVFIRRLSDRPFRRYRLHNRRPALLLLSASDPDRFLFFFLPLFLRRGHSDDSDQFHFFRPDPLDRAKTISEAVYVKPIFNSELSGGPPDLFSELNSSVRFQRFKECVWTFNSNKKKKKSKKRPERSQRALYAELKKKK